MCEVLSRTASGSSVLESAIEPDGDAVIRSAFKQFHHGGEYAKGRGLEFEVPPPSPSPSPSSSPSLGGRTGEILG